MKKLLHERLREWANTCDEIAIDGEWYINPFTPHIAKLLSDEIERYYIPLPCDPDGEPWNIGDEFETLDVHPRCEGYLLFEGEWYLRSQHSQEFKASRCKRPSPKVLDADGVEIKVGDTVWSVGLGNKYIVFKVHESGSVDIGWPKDDGPFGGLDADKLTHKEPDSLEKLRDDMRNGGGESLLNFVSRFLAIMERDA